VGSQDLFSFIIRLGVLRDLLRLVVVVVVVVVVESIIVKGKGKVIPLL
jgi:hypothetical protein